MFCQIKEHNDTLIIQRVMCLQFEHVSNLNMEHNNIDKYNLGGKIEHSSKLQMTHGLSREGDSVYDTRGVTPP